MEYYIPLIRSLVCSRFAPMKRMWIDLRFLFLVLSCICVVICDTSVNHTRIYGGRLIFRRVPQVSQISTFHMNVYWKSNKAGMFSHLLQTKLMYELSYMAQRKLIVSHFTSKHYPNQTNIDLCSFFDFSGSGVQCGLAPANMSCFQDPKLFLKSKVENICYNDEHLANLIRLRGMGITNAIWISLPVKINSSRLTSYDAILDDLLEHDRASRFTVVHWRRGDQLELRCKPNQDISVNCGNASTLIDRIREHSQDKIVYVATNEPQDSSEMDVLRKAGYKTLSNVVSMTSGGSGNGSSNSGTAAAQQRQQRYNALDTLSVLAVEYSLMVRADTYLAWGISEIDDVVEYERMKLGKTHCVTQNHMNGKTWCDVRHQNSRYPTS